MPRRGSRHGPASCIGGTDVSDEIAELEAELAGSGGEVRGLLLVRLGQQLLNRYWESGPGTSDALPFLDQAIARLEEALEHLEPGDANRVHTSVVLGIAYCVRDLAHHPAAADRDTGIELIAEGLVAGSVPPTIAALAYATVGSAYLRRVLDVFQADQGMMLLIRGASPEIRTDVEAAVANLQQAVDASPTPQAAEQPRMMLRMAVVVQNMVNGLGGPSAQLDVLMKGMADLQELERAAGRTSAVAASGWRLMPEEPADSPRSRIRYLINVGDLYAVTTALLKTGPPPWIDDFVALATEVVYTADSPTGVDRFLLAVALHLRGRRDAGGWPDAYDELDDSRAAVEVLLTAAPALIAENPDSVPVLAYLASLSPGDALTRLADHMGAYSERLRSSGTEVLQLPAPADALRWNAAMSRFEAADAQ